MNSGLLILRHNAMMAKRILDVTYAMIPIDTDIETTIHDSYLSRIVINANKIYGRYLTAVAWQRRQWVDRK